MKRSVWRPRNLSFFTATLLGVGVFILMRSDGQWKDFAVAQDSGGVAFVPEEEAPSLSLDEVLSGLKSPDEKMRETATQALRNRSAPASPQEGIRLLRAAAIPYPALPKSEQSLYGDTSSLLVKSAAEQFYPAYLLVIQEVFAGLSNQAKLRALRLLADRAADHKDRAAITAFMAIFQAHAKAGRIPELEEWVMRPLRDKPVFSDVLFPRFLGFSDQPELAPTIFFVALWYCDAGVLKPRTVAPYAGHLLRTYEPLRHWLAKQQRPTGHEWMWTKAYQEKRDAAAILLDVMAYFPTPTVSKALQQSLTFRDPRLKHFALISLLRQGHNVAAKEIEAVAASDEMRLWLYHTLDAIGKLSVFPRRYATQKALAQSDMVQWLTFPTELGRVPDEIQLMKVVPISRSKGKAPLDYYVFRFRVKGDSDGWLAGVAGPYPRGKSSTVAGSDTFSRFEKWSERTPEGHVQARLGKDEE